MTHAIHTSYSIQYVKNNKNNMTNIHGKSTVLHTVLYSKWVETGDFCQLRASKLQNRFTEDHGKHVSNITLHAKFMQVGRAVAITV